MRITRTPRTFRAPAGTHRVLFAVWAAGVAAVDQAGKAWAVTSRHRRGVLVRNSGAAFGLGARWTLGISLLTVLAVLLLVATGLRPCSRPRAVAMALMAGGAAGNGADRLLRGPGAFHGAVVDWITVPGYGPAFNLADIALRSGALLTLALALAPGRARST